MARREVVLIVEPADFARHRIGGALRADHRDVRLASNAAQAIGLLAEVKPDVVLVGLELSDLPGPRAVAVFAQRCHGAAVLAIGASPSVDEAVEAVRRGAVDYITAHDAQEEIAEKAERALTGVRRERERGQLRRGARDHLQQILCQSRGMMNVIDQIRQVAQTNATVLILGEVGTGRELVARAIHERSGRNGRPFIGVSCDAYAPPALEVELFGPTQTALARTAEPEGVVQMAEGGSLFLDEVGATRPSLQVQLLELLEYGSFHRPGRRDAIPVDVRTIAATGPHLEKLVAAGKFRQDLFYRLNVFPIRLPALRERPEDIPLLTRHFLEESARQYRREIPGISERAMGRILSYAWPGNVRELRSLCDRWVLLGGCVDLSSLPSQMLEAAPVLLRVAPKAARIDEHATLKQNLNEVVEEIERIYLESVLTRCGGHLRNTAEAAGITRRTLYTKMRQHGLSQQDYRGASPGP